jgi:hypothetical protein
MTDLVYALLQVSHNFGAAAVVASPIFASWLGREQPTIQRRLAWLVVFGAMIQVGSGIGFGLTSYLLKGHLPEIEGVAYGALLVKVFCVIASPAIVLRFVLNATKDETRKQRCAWLSALILGSTAFTAAAFLRWYL